MRRNVAKLVGVVLTAALCVTLVPVQTAKAEDVVLTYMPGNAGTADLEMTGSQLLEAYTGKWEEEMSSFAVSEDKLVVEDWMTGETKEIDWTYQAETKVIENVPLTEADAIDQREMGVDPEGKAKAIHFTDAENDYYLYKGYNLRMGTTVVNIMGYSKDSGDLQCSYIMAAKYIDDESYTVQQALELAKQAVAGDAEEPKAEEPKVEEPKPEEPKEEPKVEEPAEEPKTEEPKTEVKLTASGREMYAGEDVYIVQSGDCLWAIARKLLGNGAKYNELFTRNGDIVKKATLIFPGQEIIYKAK